MTIHDVSEMWSRSTATSSVTADLKNRSLEFGYAYQVVHSIDATEEEILADSRIPALGARKINAGFIFVRDRRVRRASPLLSYVEVSAKGEIGPNGEHPANKLPIIDWTDEETDEEIDTDIEGNPIMTVVGEPIYGVREKFQDLVANVERNFRTIDLYAISRYRRAVNSDTFLGWPPGTVILAGWKAKLEGDTNQGGYWKVNAKLKFRRPVHTTAAETWYKRVRHEGLYELKDGEPVRAVDFEGNFVTRPVLLKADGTREYDLNAAHWLTFKTRYDLPFSTLGLLF